MPQDLDGFPEEDELGEEDSDEESEEEF